MMNYTISKEWFDEIKDMIKYANPYVYVEDNKEKVEVDILNVEEFEKTSKKFGWMA